MMAAAVLIAQEERQSPSFSKPISVQGNEQVLIAWTIVKQPGCWWRPSVLCTDCSRDFGVLNIRTVV